MLAAAGYGKVIEEFEERAVQGAEELRAFLLSRFVSLYPVCFLGVSF